MADFGKVAVIALTPQGSRKAQKIAQGLANSQLYLPSTLKEEGWGSEGATFFEGKLRALVPQLFTIYDGLVMVMATGIAVRMVGPLLKDKHQDPAVVCVDDFGRYAISLLGGHERGANALTMEVTNLIGAEPVVTTGSEAVKDIVIGIGCRKGVSSQEVVEAIYQALEEAGLSKDRVRLLATVEIKNQEQGLIMASRQLGIPLRFLSLQRLSSLKGGYKPSQLVQKKLGIGGVCEPSALLASRGSLLVPKQTIGKVCLAIVREDSS